MHAMIYRQHTGEDKQTDNQHPKREEHVVSFLK
jgi:hypothetical protein